MDEKLREQKIRKLERDLEESEKAIHFVERIIKNKRKEGGIILTTDIDKLEILLYKRYSMKREIDFLKGVEEDIRLKPQEYAWASFTYVLRRIEGILYGEEESFWEKVTHPFENLFR